MGRGFRSCRLAALVRAPNSMLGDVRCPTSGLAALNLAKDALQAIASGVATQTLAIVTRLPPNKQLKFTTGN